MPGVVVDTHTMVWYLSADSRLSANAADALDSATAAGEPFTCHRFVSWK
jgi:PIN domain nuclease of toxin-antitoxin system